ncbi:MAG: bifunctional 5,10-methylenetetrahydrofolate dehydrogenase/5,10-methenyltetrahydrofolate cyclohydrolase [Candidatus Paceibacterota bacterium]
MLVDGKQIQQDIKEKLTALVHKCGERPHLTLVYVGEDPVIDTYIDLKRRFGEDIGVHINIERYPADIERERFLGIMRNYGQSDADGIVLQLPLPDHIDTGEVLNLVPAEKDVDVLSETAFKAALHGDHPLPPVVGAIQHIFDQYDVDLSGKKVVVVGKGRLVGKPVSLWLFSQKVPPVILQKGDDVSAHTREADIIISGAGDPHFITPDMVKDGVILIDAGTSDVAGETRGDMHPDVAQKAELFSPVPGGVGPVTVAKLFENLLILSGYHS